MLAYVVTFLLLGCMADRQVNKCYVQEIAKEFDLRGAASLLMGQMQGNIFRGFKMPLEIFRTPITRTLELNIFDITVRYIIFSRHL